MIPQSMTHKILARAAGRPCVANGEVIEAAVDMCFAYDAVIAPLRTLFYGTFGGDARVWDPGRIALFQDHFVPARDAATRNLALVMDRFASEQGISKYYPYGPDYGICHVVMCERGHVRPGEVVIGTDSHSVTYGAFNAFGTGVGVVDIVSVFGSGRLWFRVPEVIQVRIDGDLRPGVQAKDVGLRLLRDLGLDGAAGKAIEWVGSTIDALSVDERMTLCNMVVEAGAKNGIMTLSARARTYLAGVIGDVPAGVTSDPDFPYEHVVTYRAQDLESMVAFPPSPADGRPIGEVKARRIRVDQVYVGSCTGAKFEDLETVARIVAGHRVASGLQLVVVPASSAIYRRLAQAGLVATLAESGAVIESPGCKACFGAQGGILGDGEVCLATTNRNFKGRMGNPRAHVYLASPYVAAKTALAGHITD